MSLHRIVVDDTSPSIQYSNEWIDRLLSISITGDGPALFNTAHATTNPRTPQNLTFAFNGSDFSVWGLLLDFATPKWTCLVDGRQIPTRALPTTGTHLIEICSPIPGQFSLSDGPHTLFVAVDLGGVDGAIAWFDYITYTPSASVLTGDFMFDASDTSMTYSGDDWQLSGIGTYTEQKGAKLSFDFFGSSIAWIGTYNNNLPRGASTGTYTIDGGPPANFTINNVASISTPILFNQVFFQVSQDTIGPHHLEVEFQGPLNSNGLGSTSLTGTPLSLSYILVRDAKNVDSGASVTTTSATSSTPTATITPDSSRHGHAKAPVIGAVVGSIVAVVALLLLSAFLWRRRRSKPVAVKGKQQEELEVHPFTSPPSEITSVGQLSSKRAITTTQEMSSFRNSVVRPSKAQMLRTSNSQLEAATTESVSASDDGSQRLASPVQQAATANTVVIEVPPNYTVT